MAKVHYIGLIGAANVRTFFRLRQTQVTYADYDYPPGVQYRRTPSNPDGQPIPLAGIQNGEYVTVPCFALSRVDSKVVGMDRQTDSRVDGSLNVLGNIQTIKAQADGSEVDTFFGCWVNQSVSLLHLASHGGSTINSADLEHAGYAEVDGFYRFPSFELCEGERCQRATRRSM